MMFGKAMKTLFCTFLLIGSCCCSAEEPGWTAAERAANRQVVISASTKSVERVRDQPNENIHLMRAELTVTKIKKGAKLIGDAKEIVVYFETSPLGAGYRCPTFPVLKEGEAGRFYLRYDTSLTDENAFVLEMGSDFITPGQEAEQAGGGVAREPRLKSPRISLDDSNSLPSLQPSSSDKKLNEADVAQIAFDVIKDRVISLDGYSPPKISHDSKSDTWVAHYWRKPAVPGGYFSITVHDKTKKVEFVPGR